MALQKITPFLWFESQAEEAAGFYVSVFRNSRIVQVARYGEAGKETHGRPPGSVMTVAFELDGQPFTALNGGPHFKFTEAVSFVVGCKDQSEIELERAARAKADHISTAPVGERVRVTWHGELIADSRDALAMKEGDYPVVHYVPRKDVRMDRLERTSHSTHCPFKGDASYFSLKGGPQNAVWSYERPYEEMAAIRDHVAFYPDKVDSISIG